MALEKFSGQVTFRKNCVNFFASNLNSSSLLISSCCSCRIRQHVSDPHNPPILIFPEGTCINNTSVMQFKKGSFEVGSIIYPVAIKVIFYFSFC